MAEQPTQTNNRNDKDKKNKVFCMGCNGELESNHTGTICVQDHHICPECSVQYINVIFEAPEQNIPLKCMICKQEVVINTFERQLTHDQAQIFLLYNMQYNPKAILNDDEVIASCPFCTYFEINTKDQGRLLFLCKQNECCKTSCIWCKKLIKNKDDISDDVKYDMDQDDVEQHFECAQLAPHKAKWDKAISDGTVLPCPNCGLAGQKDNACTHMTCLKCKQEWCYGCGLTLEQVDKRQGVDNFMGHNNNWKKNPKRCPLYLDSIREIDVRWPEDDSDACVAYLHQLRTMGFLKKVMTEMGDENFAMICEKYGVDKNCGFDMKEVMTGDHTLIIRKDINYNDESSSSEEEEEEDDDW